MGWFDAIVDVDEICPGNSECRAVEELERPASPRNIFPREKSGARMVTGSHRPRN